MKRAPIRINALSIAKLMRYLLSSHSVGEFIVSRCRLQTFTVGEMNCELTR